MRVTTFVYAVVTTRTHRSNVTGQGFGSSSRLTTPEPPTTDYRYAARWAQPVRNCVGNSNRMTDLTALGRNFAHNAKGFPIDPKMPILLSFEPTEALKQEAQNVGDATVEVRPLTGPEQEIFLRAYLESE